jgi:hypothetical protein
MILCCPYCAKQGECPKNADDNMRRNEMLLPAVKREKTGKEASYFTCFLEEKRDE